MVRITMVFVVDPRGAGISGDMMLAALVDMGADGGAIADHMHECAAYLDGSSISHMSFQPEYRNQIRCTRLVLETQDPAHRPATEMADAIRRSVAHMGLSEDAAAFAMRSMNHLASAESRIHGSHGAILHEAASIDTLVDIVGTAAALDQTGVIRDTILAMPTNVGSGLASFSHGTYPNPVPAVLEILKEARMVMVGSSIDAELTTPTGACILAGMRAEPCRFYPCITVGRTGHGAGTADHPGIANILVVAQSSDALETQSVCMLETNVDDITGEDVGAAIRGAIDAGALDAAVYPGTGKKGRVSYLLRVLCMPDMIHAMTQTIIHHTGTLGIRIIPSERFVLTRQERRIRTDLDGEPCEFRYKTYKGGTASGFKIESDDLDDASRKTGMDRRSVERLVRREIEDNT